MKIKSLMIPDPITIMEDASIEEAINTMKSNSIRHLPVTNRKNVLKGFVTMADLRIGLIPSMVADVTLSDLMIKDPITIDPESDIEIAAQLIYKHKIGGMPVVKGSKLVGILTETDILRAFIDMMGILHSTSRVDVVIGNKIGVLKDVLNVIQEHGGEVINAGLTSLNTKKKTYFFRLSACETEPIKCALENEGFEVTYAVD